MSTPHHHADAEALQTSPAAPQVRRYEGETLIQVYALTPHGLTLGKAPSNDVVVEAPQVSRFHARIDGEKSHWVLADCGSRNGTFIFDRERLLYSSQLSTGPWMLRDQYEISLGPPPHTWRLLFYDPTSTEKPLPVALDPRRRRVWIRGVPLALPRDHFTVLLQLYQQAPFPCSYEALCAAIEQDRQTRERRGYAEREPPSLDALHHLIHRLRARIEIDPKHPQLLVQEPHFGYRLRNEPDLEAS
jgi:hypothetical protein